MKFLRRAVFLDTTVVQAGTFDEALELFKDEDYCYPGKPTEVQYFLQEDKVTYSIDEGGNCFIHPIGDKNKVLLYAESMLAERVVSAINMNSSTRLFKNG